MNETQGILRIQLDCLEHPHTLVQTTNSFEYIVISNKVFNCLYIRLKTPILEFFEQRYTIIIMGFGFVCSLGSNKYFMDSLQIFWSI